MQEGKNLDRERKIEDEGREQGGTLSAANARQSLVAS